MKVFWEEQKLISQKVIAAVRYHPMKIRWCLSISSKSAAAEDEVPPHFTDLELLQLPSGKTLGNYRTAVTPHCGFNSLVIQELSLKKI